MKYVLNFHFNRIFCSVHVQYGLTFHEVLMDYIVERLRFDIAVLGTHDIWTISIDSFSYQTYYDKGSPFPFEVRTCLESVGDEAIAISVMAAWVIASQPSTFHTLLQSTPKRHKHCNHFTIQWLPQNSVYAQVTWTSNSADSYSIPTEQKRLYRRTCDFHIEYHSFDTESVAVFFYH